MCTDVEAVFGVILFMPRVFVVTSEASYKCYEFSNLISLALKLDNKVI